METITKSFNVFVDTALGTPVDDSNGMNYQLNFNNLAIDCPDDGFFRLSLVDFCMLKTFTNINTHNSKFILRLQNSPADAVDYELEIPHKNYDTINSLAKDFFGVIATQIIIFVNNQTANTLDNYSLSNTNPSELAGISGTSSNVLLSTITFTKASAPVNISTFLTSATIQTYIKLPVGTKAYSTAYQILGSTLIEDNTNRTSASMTTILDLANGKITFSGSYPALRFNEPYIYLRCSLPSSNLATTALDYYTRQTGEKTDLHHSNILARFPIDSEVVNYNANNNYEFFIDLHQQHLTNIKFYLTMAHGEKVPEHANYQNTLGNQSFSMTLRLDIIRKIKQNQTNFGNVPLNFPKDMGNPLLSVSSNRRIK